ncbi:putative polymyxin resistance deacetylase [Wigglesworthia glossinidia endosymbiont of Glossina morsitans morsitans (Yale colony)]|uniref:Putative polymyxin resistance deacetylase n=1 Tax=Wigglesworthia glossinidia endosymbiont of Glossina morsitans morsitans (Yale colony) TaxID=1142511 RepID=H6Q5F1_WIGGL|nr:4-deoxy-4-formamido-L-arabinose-phosphoundecaprenol deformylase [Wigglesworthia glossinidia]AFA41434.1 putative polymyxin resistance deacetylase [Wigglesworthia glossinidia endosymbiont of Glossina morsitans morsitans (Yale colony)]
MNNLKKVGLRIDVDTLRGTKYGVLNLLEILNNYQIKATFFFTVGPDNMGRHFWRLFKPKFLIKMLRINPIKTYGWSILRCGLIGKSKKIGDACKNHIILAARKHEIGLHAWDHFEWQNSIDTWRKENIINQITLGKKFLESIINSPILCFAAPGWRTSDSALQVQKKFNFSYNSDVRGIKPFFPLLSDKSCGNLQIPVTLPTFDEVINNHTTLKKYNNFIINQMKKQSDYSVYTIHAEIEGIKYLKEFKELLYLAKNEGIQFCRLNQLIEKNHANFPICKLIRKKISGREGWIMHQNV